MRTGTVSVAVGIASVLLNAYVEHNRHLAVAGLMLPALFIASFRLAPLTRLLSLPWVTKVGAASYSLYLLHQVVGVALIHFLAAAIHLTGPVAAVVALVVAAALILLSRLIFLTYEHPLNRVLARSLIKIVPADATIAQGVP